MEHAGSTIRITREAQGLTLRDLAKKAGVSFSYLSRVERGELVPTDRWLRDVAAVLGENMASIRRSA